MPKYSNSNYTTISLKYCYEELQKFYPQMTKTEFAVIINATRQNIGQRINRDSKLSKQELSILKEYLEDRGIPTKFLNVAVVNNLIQTSPCSKSVGGLYVHGINLGECVNCSVGINTHHFQLVGAEVTPNDKAVDDIGREHGMVSAVDHLCNLVFSLPEVLVHSLVIGKQHGVYARHHGEACQYD